MFDFSTSLKEWERIPIDDFDYMTAKELLALHADQFREIVSIAWGYRWRLDQWRNRNNSLIDFMQPQRWADKVVMDFGCGLGLDGLRFAIDKAGVLLADIHPMTLLLAQQTLARTAGLAPLGLCVTRAEYPFFFPRCKIDLFWSMGVLHHTPKLPEILKQACEELTPDGEIRICVYSDKRWEEMTGTKASVECPVHEHPKFAEFVRKCDTVGNYADWYHQTKLAVEIKEFARIKECKYLCDNQMLGAVIVPKGRI